MYRIRCEQYLRNLDKFEMCLCINRSYLHSLQWESMVVCICSHCSQAGADAAIANLNGKQIFDGSTRPMIVKFADTPEEKQQKKVPMTPPGWPQVRNSVVMVMHSHKHMLIRSTMTRGTWWHHRETCRDIQERHQQV